MDKLNAIEVLKDIKGIFQTAYDHFKHMSTLSIASIGAILVFVTKILPFPNLPKLAVILVVISLLFLMVSLCISLEGMTGYVGVSIKLTNMCADILSEANYEERTSKYNESADKFKKKTKRLNVYDIVTKYAYMFGIIFFFASACVSLISNKNADGQIATNRLGSKMPAQHENVPLPPHLKDASMFEPPLELLDFAQKHGAEHVALVDDKDRCKNSVRADAWLFVNTRGTYWGNLITPPWNASTYSEATILRFLHELGHVFLNHKSDGTLISSPNGLIIKAPRSPWDAFRNPQEFDAWVFAFELRHKDPSKFNDLISVYSDWALSHTFMDKDWDDTADLQFYRISGRHLSDQVFTIPEWVQKKFKKDAPHILLSKTR